MEEITVNEKNELVSIEKVDKGKKRRKIKKDLANRKANQSLTKQK